SEGSEWGAIHRTGRALLTECPALFVHPLKSAGDRPSHRTGYRGPSPGPPADERVEPRAPAAAGGSAERGRTIGGQSRDPHGRGPGVLGRRRPVRGPGPGIRIHRRRRPVAVVVLRGAVSVP